MWYTGCVPGCVSILICWKVSSKGVNKSTIRMASPTLVNKYSKMADAKVIF